MEQVELREPKLEMTSFSDNAYDVTKFFVVLKSSWPILYSYQVSLLSDTKWQSQREGFFCPPPPPSNIRVARTPSNIGLILKLTPGKNGSLLREMTSRED